MLRAALLLALLSGAARATEYVGSVSGAWSNSATWGGLGVPGAGDNTTILAGVQVAIPLTYSVVTSSISMVSGASFGGRPILNIQGGLTLTGAINMGTVSSGYAEIDMSSGSVLNLQGNNILEDSSGSSYNYLHFIANASSHAVVNGGGGKLSNANGGGFRYEDDAWTNVDFSSMGVSIGMYNGAGADFKMSSCSYTGSGTLILPQENSPASANRYIEYSDFRGPTSGQLITINAGDATKPTNRNEFMNTTFSSATAASLISIQSNASSVTFHDNVFVNMAVNDASFGLNSQFYNNASFVTLASGNAYITMLGSSTINNNFWYSEGDNPHWWNGGENSTQTYVNNILETNTQGTITDDGDVLLVGAATGGGILTAVRNLHIGHRNGSVFLSMQGSATSSATITVNNNTNYEDPGTSATKNCNRIGETYAGRSNFVASLRNNLCVWVSSNSLTTIINDEQNGTGGAQKVSTGNYNGNWNVGGAHYASMVGTYGVNDIMANPNFVDPTRELLTWDTSIGGAGTSADAIAGILKMNGYGGTYNTAYSVPALMSYVKAGFTPTNQVYKGAGFDGSDIGAFAVGSAAPATTKYNRWTGMGGPVVPMAAFYGVGPLR